MSQVHGGVAGLAVQYDELERTSVRLRQEADALLRLAVARHRLLADGDLLASAVLVPGGVARVEAALLSALHGPDGLVAAGGALELRAGQLLVAVARYRAADVLEAEQEQVRHWLLLGAAPLLLPAAVLGGAGWAAAVAARGADPLAALEAALVAHPGVVSDALGVLGTATAPVRAGLAGPLPVLTDQAFRAVTGEALLPRDLAEAAGLLALLYDDGQPVWEQRPDDAPAAVLVPAGVGDLLARLHHRDLQAVAGTPTAGDIGVTRLVSVGRDGQERVSWVVDLPGTKAWQPDPRTRPGLNDLASNLELTAGSDNARVQAVARLLEDAGAARDDPVLLVGHSQGGMVAVRAAQELAGRFAVSHVVTAGSPVGGMPLPPRVQVLSLENRHDVVPYADGRDNADRPEHVTVVFAHHGSTVCENHGTGTAYLPAARALDTTTDASVRAWLDGAHDFLAGPGEQVRATTTVYAVSNDADGDGRVDVRR